MTRSKGDYMQKNDLKKFKGKIPNKVEMILMLGNELIYKIGMLVFVGIVLYELLTGAKLYAASAHVCMVLFWLVGVIFHMYIRKYYGISENKIETKDDRK